ncbi:hypothetical protein C3418_09985 [Aeromonas sp. ASNIH8]|nr:hypothetical protein C3418_09985 [Aeromonas sp. ASNIH8]
MHFPHIPDLGVRVVNDCFHPLINSVRTPVPLLVTKHAVWISPGGIFMVQQSILLWCYLLPSPQRCCRHIERHLIVKPPLVPFVLCHGQCVRLLGPFILLHVKAQHRVGALIIQLQLFLPSCVF